MEKNMKELISSLKEWHEGHQSYYNEYIHAIKDYRNIDMPSYMHIYDYAMKQISNLPHGIVYGSKEVYGNAFKEYYYKFKFSDTLGMLAQIFRMDSLTALQSLADNKKLRMAILYWVVEGDFHENLIKHIKKHPKERYDSDYGKIEYTVIKNGLLLGILTEEDCTSYLNEHLLILSQKQLENCFAEYKNEDESEVVQTDNIPSVGIAAPETIENCGPKNNLMSPDKSTKRVGRHKAFDGIDSLFELMVSYTKDEKKAAIVVDRMKEEMNSKDVNGIAMTAMVVALEYLGLVCKLEDSKVTGFFRLLEKEIQVKRKANTFAKHHTKLYNFFRKPEKYGTNIDEKKKREYRELIENYIRIFQEYQ